MCPRHRPSLKIHQCRTSIDPSIKVDHSIVTIRWFRDTLQHPQQMDPAWIRHYLVFTEHRLDISTTAIDLLVKICISKPGRFDRDKQQHQEANTTETVYKTTDQITFLASMSDFSRPLNPSNFYQHVEGRQEGRIFPKAQDLLGGVQLHLHCQR